jgi:hypothetical protein
MLILDHSSLRTAWLVPIALVGPALNVQAPEAQHAVPLANEPHYRLIFENSYARVFRVSLPAHDATPTLLHQHDLPYVYVPLGPADFVDAVAGKAEVHVVMTDGQVAYSQGGFGHIIRTDVGSPLESVIIELLRPQGGPQNTCAEIVPGPPAYHCSGTPAGSRKDSSYMPLFKTDETDVSLQWLGPDTAQVGFTPRLGTLCVILSGSNIQRVVKGKSEEALSAGSVLWLLAESNTNFSNLSGKPWSYLLLSFSGTEPFYRDWKPR